VPPLVECHTPPAVRVGADQPDLISLVVQGTIFAALGKPELTVRWKLVPLVLTVRTRLLREAIELIGSHSVARTFALRRRPVTTIHVALEEAQLVAV